MSNHDNPENAPKRPSPTSPSAPPHRRGFPWATIILVLAIVVGVVFYFNHRKQGAAGEKGGPAGAGARGNFPVPVIIGTAVEKNMPIYLDGLGTVQAYNTVTVRTRVDGQLQKLAFTEGQDVRSGDLLAQIDPAPFQTQLEQATAKKAQDEAQLQLAKVELKRNEDLLKSKIVSQETYDTSKATVQQFEAAVLADQAAIDNAKVQLDYTTVRAPIEGRTGLRQVDQGNIIHATDTNGIVVLTQMKPISMIFTLPEQSLQDIKQHLSSEPLKVLAMDRDNKNVLEEGALAVVDNQIDVATGTIRLKANFANEKVQLWPGQFTNARLLLTTRTNAVVVPASVVQRGPEGSYAFIVKPDMSVEMRPVKVGPIEQDQAIIEEGLKPGEKIVVDGQFKLQPGSKVKPAEAGGGSTNAPAADNVHKQGGKPGQSQQGGEKPGNHKRSGSTSDQ